MPFATARPLARPAVAVLSFLIVAAASSASAQTILGPAGNTSGGAAFSDQCPSGVAGITVRAGWWVDGVQLLCRGPGGLPQAQPARGGSGGDGRTFLLIPGERIAAISGTWSGPAGPYIYSIAFTTSTGRTATYGNGGSDRGRMPYRLDVPAGAELRGLAGRASDYLYAIGLVIGPSGGPVVIAPAAPAPGASGKSIAPMSPMGPVAPAQGVGAATAAPAMSAAPGAVTQPPVLAGQTDYLALANNPAPAAAAAPAAQPNYEARPIEWNTGSGGYCPQPNAPCMDPMAGFRWRAAQTGTIPAGALNLSRNASQPAYACRAPVGPVGGGAAGNALGYVNAQTGGCVIAASPRQPLVAPTYEVLLAPPAGTIWVEITNGALPRALQAAVRDGQALALCATDAGGATQVGYATDTSSGCVTVVRGVPGARYPYRAAIRNSGGM